MKLHDNTKKIKRRQPFFRGWRARVDFFLVNIMSAAAYRNYLFVNGELHVMVDWLRCLVKHHFKANIIVLIDDSF